MSAVIRVGEFKSDGMAGKFYILDINDDYKGHIYMPINDYVAKLEAPVTAEELRAIADKLDEMNKQEEK